MSYAETNGISLYYEEHGTGDPLVLLHGGFGSIENFDGVREALCAGRRLVLVDLQGHGRTPEVDRPLKIETLADDVAGLIEQLGGTADVLGYSFGGEVALRLGIQHPERVRNLVVVSVAAKRDGNFPEVIARLRPDGRGLRPDPAPDAGVALYERVAPDPAAFDAVVAKAVDLLHHDYDWTAEVEGLTPRTLLLFADADSIRPDHVREIAGLLGIGHRDAGWDGSAKPTNQLAVLPGMTHYDVIDLTAVRAGGGRLPGLGDAAQRRARGIAQASRRRVAARRPGIPETAGIEEGERFVGGSLAARAVPCSGCSSSGPDAVRPTRYGPRRRWEIVSGIPFGCGPSRTASRGRVGASAGVQHWASATLRWSAAHPPRARRCHSQQTITAPVRVSRDSLDRVPGVMSR